MLRKLKKMAESLRTKERDIITITPWQDASFNSMLSHAIQLAKDTRSVVRFRFKEATVYVDRKSDPVRVRRAWLLQRRRGIINPTSLNISPSPAKARTVCTKRANYLDGRIAELQARLAEAPAMDFIDPMGWENERMLTRDPQWERVRQYSERWARLMQLEMLQGRSIAQVAQRCAKEADIEAISSLELKSAANILWMYWRHGEELCRWYDSEHRRSARAAIGADVVCAN